MCMDGWMASLTGYGTIARVRCTSDGRVAWRGTKGGTDGRFEGGRGRHGRTGRGGGGGGGRGGQCGGGGGPPCHRTEPDEQVY